jgi:hypothetical protein
MPTNYIMDEKRANETIGVLMYDEAKKGLAAAIGVPDDDWDKSFGQKSPAVVSEEEAFSLMS